MSDAEVSFETKYIHLPPIRRCLEPDPGHVLFDCDLSGADAQVVAWEANEPRLKAAFRSGVDIHNFNGTTVFGESYSPKLVRHRMTWRDEMKRSVHGTNYLAGISGLAKVLGWTQNSVLQFQMVWFSTYPGIKDWHRRVDYNLQKTRKVANQFGYRIIYLDRAANALPKAIAWGPQSTVAIVCDRGGRNVRRNLPWCEILLQVHDSLIFQLPFHLVTPSKLEEIKRHLEIPILYPGDPLVIPWGLKSSNKSWGDLGPKLDWSTLLPVKKP